MLTAEVGGNALTVIESGEARLERLLALIAGATSHIEMLFYMFNADRSGRAVRDALTAAAKRGVVVKLLIDGFGSGAPSEFFDRLGLAGGQFCVFNPAIGRRYLLRNHQKLVIIDDRVALIGGANIDKTYLQDDGPQHWRDLWMTIEGPAVICASEYFDSLFRWTHRKNGSLRSLRRMVSHYSQWRGPVQWKFSGPMSAKNSWWRSIGRDIRRGKSLDMVFAYFAPPGTMLRRIGRLGRRGHVRIVTAAKSDNSATIAASRHTYSRLLRRHVCMYEYQAAKLHTKLAVVDDVVYIGSSNFDYRSLYINLEVMLRVKDAKFAEMMRRFIDREVADSKWITPEGHKSRSNPWLRIKWAVSYFLVNVLDYTVTRRLNFRFER
ncbi:phosphatidylserine/phosphatidylglycerophosphate/cardiolipin synthase family protein [Sphingomonas lutea]|uniref:Phospholipase D n=2 Tax=Sphingomonas lutea TaxID=1045317 RepID=A0A7G9SKT3_9SPHN|nr:phosphatidylserine/phosphatidylglycerophosphate/cardiolipin synthase family protein [Sphingomonas lutea]